MRLIDRVRHVFRIVFRRRQVERDLDEELSSWIGELTDRHRARGAGVAEARRLALAEVGGVESLKQTVRDQQVGRGWRGFGDDLRYAWRALRRTPGFTLASVLTFGLGIGATTAIFSVVSALLLSPLPFREPGRLVIVWSDMTSAGYPRAPLSGPEVIDLRERSTTLAGVGAIWSTTNILTGDDNPQQLRVGLVTTNFFDVLGASAALGRTFGPQDDTPTPSAGILLSWPLFQQRFGGRASVVGTRILVSGRPTTVIGVMPRGFRLFLPSDAAVPDDLQAWVPVSSAALARAPRGQQYLRVIGRMRPGVTVEQASQDVSAVAGRLSRAFAEYGSAGRVFTTLGLQHDDVRTLRSPLLALFAGVSILLVIACVNVAGLLIARAAARTRETAVRISLGASPGRLLRQCLADGLVLAVLGGMAGVGVGVLGLRVLVAWRPLALDRLATAQINAPVLAFAAAASVLWALLFSVAPVLEVLRARPAASLQRDGARATGGVRSRLRATLVVTQLALGTVLLVGAGLLARTVVALQHVDPGFRSDGMLTFRLSVPFARYRPPDAANDFARRLQAGLAALPGVTGVGAISHVPYDNLPNWGGGYVAHATADESQLPDADYRAVSPGFFEEVGARLLRGRWLTEDDTATSQPAVIVDDLLAARAFPGEDPIGKVIRVDPGSAGRATTAATIVGVVHHLRLRSLSEDLTEQVYFAERQVFRNPMAYVVRTNGDPAALTDAVRRTVSGLDPLVPIYDVRPLSAYVADASAGQRFTMALAACFAGIAVVLSCVGVYGLIAFVVARRQTEFGVRLALGARPAQVLRLVLREGASLAAAGLAAGAGIALLAARWLQSQLFGVSPMDGATYGAALAVLALAALLSSWLPARRAAAASPTDSLRSS